MTDRELMQQALRYMESIGEMDTYPEDWAIAIALRERLAQPEQEPVAMRYDFDGYGWKYIDNGSGSDWRTRIKDAEPLYTKEQL